MADGLKQLWRQCEFRRSSSERLTIREAPCWCGNFSDTRVRRGSLTSLCRRSERNAVWEAGQQLVLTEQIRCCYWGLRVPRYAGRVVPYNRKLTFLMNCAVSPCILIHWIQRTSRSTSIYRVSQEECARLREGVPYVKIYRYNPKHLCPKLNGYGDNDQRKVRYSGGSTHCTRQLTVLSMSVLECGVILRQFSSS
jgi:hypothetical protein